MSSYQNFLSKNKLYTIIEALGLIISIAFVVLIGNYVVSNFKIAFENPDRDRVYAVGTPEFLGGSWWDKEEYENKIPEVEAATRIGFISNGEDLIEVNEHKYTSVIGAVDKDFFDIFQIIHWSVET